MEKCVEIDKLGLLRICLDLIVFAYFVVELARDCCCLLCRLSCLSDDDDGNMVILLMMNTMTMITVVVCSASCHVLIAASPPHLSTPALAVAVAAAAQP